jgi:hypothetical protein
MAPSSMPASRCSTPMTCTDDIRRGRRFDLHCSILV